jgi:hypothetical protein
MKKIYEFSSTHPDRTLSVEERQLSKDEVVIRINCEGGDEYLLPLPLNEFIELCNLRYCLQFPLTR